MTTTTRLLIIDLSSIFWTLWHATSHKAVAEAFAGSLSAVERLSYGYQHVALALDAPPYKRKALFPEYKANRPEADEGARAQFRDLIAKLEEQGRVMWSSPGAEADDVIASACRSLAGTCEIVIATKDKDLSQIVADGVSVLDLNHTPARVVGPAEVVAKWGVRPDQLGDLLALTGDSSDNVPGIKGVGPVNAAKVLAAFEHLDAVIEGAPGMKDGAIKTGLLAAIADGSLALSRKLVALEDTIALDFAAALRPRHDAWEPPTTAAAPVPAAAPMAEVKAFVATVAPEPRPVALAVRAPEPRALVTRAVATPEEWTLALEPRSSDEAWELAQRLADSRMFGGVTQSQIFGMALFGRSLGIDVVTTLRNCHIIDGKLCPSAGLIAGLVVRSGKADFWKLVETTPERATYRTHRKDDPDPEPTTLTFTIEQAAKRKLTGKKNWIEMPDEMLRARASVSLARIVYPEIAAGLYLADELEAA